MAMPALRPRRNHIMPRVMAPRCPDAVPCPHRARVLSPMVSLSPATWTQMRWGSNVHDGVNDGGMTDKMGAGGGVMARTCWGTREGTQ